MAETIPSLLKKLKDAENTIRQLKENKFKPKVEYYTDPAQEDMIRRLQDRIRELESGD